MNLSNLVVGVVREIMPGERRVAATPETVKRMTVAGARVLIEAGAGEGSYFADRDYAAEGAEICPDAASVFRDAGVILKVKEPRFDDRTGDHEADRLRPDQKLVCFLHPGAPANRDLVKRLAESGATTLTLDGIPRISRAQAMDALTSMSTVAGYKGILMAADLLPKFIPMAGTAAGVIPPSTVLVIGAGVAGLQAMALAKRMGANVVATDIRADALEQARSLGAETVELGIPADVSEGPGGYAQALPPEWLHRERDALAAPLAAADIVILSALVPGRAAPILVTDEAVALMRPGSVLVDIAVDQGGNCEATDYGEATVRHGVHVLGIANIPGQVPGTATWLFARNILAFLDFLAPEGRIDVDRDDEILASTLVTRDGRIVHAGALESTEAKS